MFQNCSTFSSIFPSIRNSEHTFLYIQASLDVMEVDQTSLWFSGKEMLRGKLLKDFVGKNEKTKVIAKLQKVSHMFDI